MGTDIFVDDVSAEKATDTFRPCHQIWKQWTRGLYTDTKNFERTFPEDWFLYLHTRDGTDLVQFLRELTPKGDINIDDFIQWLEFWISHKATFQFSY